MQNALELATNAMQNRGRERTAQQFRAEHDKMLKNLPSMPDSNPVKAHVEEEIKFEQEIVSIYKLRAIKKKIFQKEENIKSEPMDQAGQDDGPLLKPVDLGATNPTLNILNPIAGAQFVPKQVRPNRTAKHPLSKNIQDQTKHLVPERVNVSIKATSAFVIKLFFQKKRKSYDQPVRDNLPNMNPYKHKMREPKQFSNGAPATSNPALPKTDDTVKTEPIEQQPSTKQQKVEEPINEDDWDDLPSVRLNHF